MVRPQRKPWKKNLYENEGYPDNYTDASFLEELRKNVNMRRVTAGEAVLGAALVTQQLCLTLAFALAFVHLRSSTLPTRALLAQAATICLASYTVCFDKTNWLRHARTMLVFLGFGYVLSPVLKTLTESISTDTIYATAVFAAAVHLVFFDYGVRAPVVSSSLSLNSAVFGSLCLASRLQTSFQVFVLMSITVECFVMAPPLLARSHGSFTAALAIPALTTYALYTVSVTVAAFFLAAVVFVNLLCPFWFLEWYKYKDNIYGPWDEAVVFSHPSDKL